MKIAIIAHPFHPIAQPYSGGLEMHTHLLANELVARGHKVVLYAKAGSESDATVIPVMNSRYTYRNYTSRVLHEYQEARMNISISLAIRLIKLGSFDYVINNSLSYLPYVRLETIPMMTILHTPATLGPVNKIISKAWKAPSAHRYVSVSESNATDWRKMLPDVCVVSNGIQVTDWRTEVTPHDDTAVWASRITKEKGLHVAIVAAKIAGMKLRIAGPISNKKYFKKEIEPLLNDRITYVGHLNHADLATFFASGSVAISSPLWEEPFGLTTVEALAAGTPVAALPHGALRDIVTPDVGAISHSDNPKDLAEAIQRAVTKSRSECQAYTQHYSTETMVDAYESIMRQQLQSLEETEESKVCRTV